MCTISIAQCFHNWCKSCQFNVLSSDVLRGVWDAASFLYMKYMLMLMDGICALKWKGILVILYYSAYSLLISGRQFCEFIFFSKLIVFVISWVITFNHQSTQIKRNEVLTIRMLKLPSLFGNSFAEMVIYTVWVMSPLWVINCCSNKHNMQHVSLNNQSAFILLMGL